MSKISSFICGVALAAASANAAITASGGWFEAAYVQWEPISSAESYNVYYTKSGGSAVQIDDQLIRTYGSYVRADALGLEPGTYTLKVVPVVSGSEVSSSALTTSSLTVIAHDRSGFAFSNSRVPGAYKADGTLKDDAIVLYITENNKDTVTLDVYTSSSKTTTCTGLQNILDGFKKGKDTRPLDIRIIGEITDPSTLYNGDIVIENNQNTSAYITLEGVGEDATVNGWGIRVKNAENIEIRNLGIMNVDSDEGDNIGLQQSNEYIWVHNCDFFYGDAGSDADQKKGDGALDCKKSTYVTFSYNHFWDNGKSNLLGLSEGTTEGYYITYHHNWYDHSDSRHPRVRYYSAHVYNNYYDGNAKYGIGVTMAGSIFAEANYFRNCKYPMLISMQGSDLYAGGSSRSTDNATFSKEDGGMIKAYNNTMEGTYTFIPYGASTIVVSGSSASASTYGIDTDADFDAVVVTSASTTLSSSITSYQGSNVYSNFDTDSDVMYSYTADDPGDVPTQVSTYAGRMNGGDFEWTFDNDEADESYDVDEDLKAALEAYASSLVSIQGEGAVVYSSSSSTATSSSSSANSSSSTATSSSSTTSTSSSSTATSSSSSSVTTSSGFLTITSDLTHDFTEDGVVSDYLDIDGNLSSSKGDVTYNGTTYTTCLKIESSTSITFTLGVSATLTMVFNSDFTSYIYINGTKYYATEGIVTAELEAGEYEIQKGNSAYLYLMIFDVEEGTVQSSSSTETEASSSTDANAPSITKHGGASSSQTVAVGESIASFYFSWENATSVTVDGLPDGIIYVIDEDAQTVTISGTPTVAGIYSYTVSTSGAASGYDEATFSATFTVTSEDGTVSSSSEVETETSSSAETETSSSSETETSSSAETETSSESSSDSGSSSSTSPIAAGIAATHFSVTTSGRTLQISGAKIGSEVYVLDIQGRMVANAKISQANVNLSVPSAGRYMVRISNQVRLVNVK